MKKLVFAIFVFVSFGAVAQTSTAVSNPNAAVIKFEEENFDFGVVDEGPKITHEFKFKNEGREPLVLSTVKASCGCTTPSWPTEPILPGQESSIVVTYNTKGRVGTFNKSVTINSNASEPITRIFIKGTVNKAEEVITTPLMDNQSVSPVLRPN